MTDYALLKAEILIDDTGSVWIMWADDPTRPYRFHSLILTTPDGGMIPGQQHLL